MFDYKMIGRRIKAARLKKGWTQGILAEKLTRAVGGDEKKQISDSYISRIEPGAGNISNERLSVFAEILSVTLEELITGSIITHKTYLNEDLISILEDLSPKQKEFAYKLLREMKDMND